jgi:HAD superfamily hydrolase (TIGR01490 family)
LQVKKIHAFDLDGTLIKGNGSFLFGKFLFESKKASIFSLVPLVLAYCRHKQGLISIEQLHNLAIKRFFYKMKFSEISESLEEFLSVRKSFFHAPALHLLQQAKDKGDIVAIVSASPSFIVNAFSRKLGVRFHLGTHYGLNHQSYFSSVKKVINSKEKVQYIRALMEHFSITKENSIAYSDSHLDVPLLEALGEAVCVRPDKILKKIALKRSWKIQH